MFGIRTLLYLAGIGLVIWILLRLSRTQRVGEKPLKQVGNMVRCAHCGTHVPENEALHAGGKAYCCREHLDRDR